MSDSAIVIAGESNVRMASLLALRSALKLETLGMRRSGRSARTIANEVMGTKHRTARATYDALNDHVVSLLGEKFNRPLR